MEIKNEQSKKLLFVEELDVDNEISFEIQEDNGYGTNLIFFMPIDHTQKLIDFLQNQLDDFNTKNTII